MSESSMAAPTPERERKGPWANRVLSTDIEKTPEYDEFIKKLSEYHEKRGTTLTIEPELGRKLLDLRKLYEKVTALGGYDKVTEEKGAWRDLALQYKLAANNTNAGYLLKTIYYKNLAAYEISNFFGKEPPPKEWLEERSAAGGSIMTRTAEDFQAPSPKSESKVERSPTPPPTEKRSLRQAPTPRTFYNPDTTSQRHNPPRATSLQHQQQNSQQSQQQQQNHQVSPGNQWNGSAMNFPNFSSNTVNAPIGMPVPTPRNAPHEFITQKRKAEQYAATTNMARFGVGHTGPSNMTRIAMGLKSGLPEEVDFALSQLVKTSYEAGDDLRAEQFPGLAEALYDKLQSVTRLMKLHSLNGSEEVLEDPAFTKQLEKVNEAALILRNMSFQVDNARYFSRLKNARSIIVAGLNLPNQTCFMELKHYILDMVESMATHLVLSTHDNMFEALHVNLLSDDRGLLLGSLKSICRFVMGRDESNRLGEIGMDAINRIRNLLMLEDEDLVSACLDFLYQYTTNEENVEKLMQPPDGIELIKQLMRLLLYQAIPGEQTVWLKTRIPRPSPPREIPNLPQEIVNDLLTYMEPERATKWMRCCFEEDPNSDITQIALWQAYQARFNDYVPAGRNLLPAAEFIKNVSIAFSVASAMVLTLPTGGQKFIIKGIRARETPMSLKGQIYVACKWIDTTGNGARCHAQLPTPQDLWVHVLNDHIGAPTDPGRKLHCNWGGCGKYNHQAGEEDRRKVIGHVRTHIPDLNDLRAARIAGMEDVDGGIGGDEEPNSKVIIRRNQTGIDDRGEAAGIPLTAALVLRNMARRGMNDVREILGAERGALFEVMAVNKPLAAYVADLLVEDGMVIDD
ncbi:uncharacterized protein LAJ45_01928 [Morchella importuna]|uniref:ARID domain-containing protein n=1 Tax=Morchella conica CCBAS932 TaxID=1392247 RepID=A0A3N4L235_9PEZI|nr:uncharacterized protein LAJ45_01928 [Morchella importuna]KAH8154160.1 hypothetical protein LAJ45_01928 [Morchella importuna]RPB16886.1 hypothetical protein P167DRAFT_516139 [Morchella conica CCBAS932]